MYVSIVQEKHIKLILLQEILKGFTNPGEDACHFFLIRLDTKFA